MSWMTDRFARLLGAPRQPRPGGAHAKEASRGPFVPAPRTESPTGDLPLPRLAELSSPAATNGASRSLTATTVLVVAPDDDVRFLLRRRCEMSPHLRVLEESKAPIGAIRSAARLRPDLIVCQVRTASDDDAELITAFKELSPGSKVFAYSTLPGGAAVSAAMKAGADRYALAGAPLSTLLHEIEELGRATGDHQGSNR